MTSDTPACHRCDHISGWGKCRRGHREPFPGCDAACPADPSVKLICSWCGATMREGEEPASHGICPACEATHFPPD